MSARKQRIVLWSAFAVCALVLFGVLVPLLARSTNCGGNSAALAQCGLIAIRARLEVAEGSPRPQEWSQHGRDEIGQLRLKHWTPQAIYLVRTNLTAKPAAKTVVAVCDTKYGNVPQPTIWNLYRKNPAHAAGYFDGSKGFLTEEEFGQLDLTNFVDVATMAAGLASTQPLKQ